MRNFRLIPILFILLLLFGCAVPMEAGGVAATTGPVAQFASAITEGTGIPVTQVISDSVSCLHDYSLSVRQMEALERSELILLSGAGLEEFMEDALRGREAIVSCADGVPLLEAEGHHDHEEHDHDHGHFDSHIWLDPANAMVMAENICAALTEAYPAHEATFRTNTDRLLEELAALDAYGQETLSDLSCRELITFHDGFGYLAVAYDLEILEAIEEESGSEASAAELIEIIELVEGHALPAIFTERNGSVSAASIISAETGVESYALDMAMGGSDYFTAMRHNIDTLHTALR